MTGAQRSRAYILHLAGNGAGDSAAGVERVVGDLRRPQLAAEAQARLRREVAEAMVRVAVLLRLLIARTRIRLARRIKMHQDRHTVTPGTRCRTTRGTSCRRLYNL